MLPEGVRDEVEAWLGPVRGARPVGGGCIHPAFRLDLDGGPAFLKTGVDASPGLFSTEARGLAALRDARSGLRVPEVLAVRDAVDGVPGWLALEWLEPGPRPPGYGERLGRGLAALHHAGGGAWGWEEDGFIGSLPQPNAPAPGWAEFWRDRRLLPQLRRARAAGLRPGSEAEWERLLAALPDLLDGAAGADGASLLHGDLWSGNVLAVGSGEPALVDPAAYRGHREVDLAMAELFGGFPAGFLAAYRESWPLAPGYGEARRGVYQLYYLLVHVNLFGGGYVPQTAAALRRSLSAV